MYLQKAIDTDYDCRWLADMGDNQVDDDDLYNTALRTVIAFAGAANFRTILSLRCVNKAFKARVEDSVARRLGHRQFLRFDIQSAIFSCDHWNSRKSIARKSVTVAVLPGEPPSKSDVAKSTLSISSRKRA